MSTALPKLRFVEEWRGLNFRYQPAGPQDARSSRTDPDSIRYIGTAGCISCVGVYFPIGNSRHFLAHVSAMVDIGVKEVNCFCECTESECKALQAKVLWQLRENERQHHWNLDRKLARKKLLMCCQRVLDRETVRGYEYRLPGLYVVKAIREFLGCPNDDQPVAYSTMEGFIVDLETEEVKMLPARDWRCPGGMDVEHAALRSYDRVATQGPLEGTIEDWMIRVRPEFMR